MLTNLGLTYPKNNGPKLGYGLILKSQAGQIRLCHGASGNIKSLVGAKDLYKFNSENDCFFNSLIFLFILL